MDIDGTKFNAGDIAEILFDDGVDQYRCLAFVAELEPLPLILNMAKKVKNGKPDFRELGWYDTFEWNLVKNERNVDYLPYEFPVANITNISTGLPRIMIYQKTGEISDILKMDLGTPVLLENSNSSSVGYIHAKKGKSVLLYSVPELDFGEMTLLKRTKFHAGWFKASKYNAYLLSP